MTKHIIDSELLEDCLIAAQGPINGHLNDRLSAILTQPAPMQGWMLVPADLIDNFPEINPNNYDHDQVCDLNDWGCDLVLAAIAAPQPSDDAKDAGEDHA